MPEAGAGMRVKMPENLICKHALIAKNLRCCDPLPKSLYTQWGGTLKTGDQSINQPLGISEKHVCKTPKAPVIRQLAGARVFIFS